MKSRLQKGGELVFIKNMHPNWTINQLASWFIKIVKERYIVIHPDRQWTSITIDWITFKFLAHQDLVWPCYLSKRNHWQSLIYFRDHPRPLISILFETIGFIFFIPTFFYPPFYFICEIRFWSLIFCSFLSPLHDIWSWGWFNFHKYFLPRS